MEAKDRIAGTMLVVFGRILFLAGIGGIGGAVWMFVSNNGGLLYWLSILVGLVCIPVTALGYVLMGEKERQEKAKETKTSRDQLSQATKHEFVRALTFIFGAILAIAGVVAIVYSVWVCMTFSEEPSVLIVPLIVGGPSLLAIIGGFLLVRKVFRDEKAKQKRISKR